MRTALLLVCLLLPACAQKTIEVKIPVYKRAAPPAELSEWHPGRLPLWIPPDGPATSCLSAEGEAQFKDMQLSLLTQLCAWEAWGAVPETPYCQNLRVQKIAGELKKFESPSP